MKKNQNKPALSELPVVPLKESGHLRTFRKARANYISWRGAPSWDGWVSQRWLAPLFFWSLRACHRLAESGHIIEGYRMAAFLNNFITATCKYWHFRSKPHLQSHIQPWLLSSSRKTLSWSDTEFLNSWNLLSCAGWSVSTQWITSCCMLNFNCMLNQQVTSRQAMMCSKIFI